MGARIPAPRWQRRPEARPQEMLDAAQALFVERGYAATRLEEVARRAGVAKATLYLYYENKLELFKAVVRHALVERFDEAAAAQAGVSLGARDQLVAMLTLFIERVALSSLSGIPKLVVSESGNFPEIARFYHDEVIERARAMVKGTLERGIASGEFRAVDVDYAWRIVIAPLLVAIIWKHSFQPFEREPLDLRRHLRAQVDLLLHGLAAPAMDKERP